MALRDELIQYFTTRNRRFKDEKNIIKTDCVRCLKKDGLIFDFKTKKYFCENNCCEAKGEIEDFISFESFNKKNYLSNFIITSCQELLDYKTQPEFFIINPLIPKEAITSITADSGKGKSLFALILAFHVASGLPLFNKYSVEKGNVLIIDQEMNSNEVASRFKKIINTNIPIDYIIEQKISITNEDNFNYLVSKIIEKKYNVIIFDTFTEIHNSEENDSGEMKKVNEQFLKLIKLIKVSIIYLHHHRKLQKGEKLSQSSSRGSSEIIAKVSSHLLLDSKNYKDEFGNMVLEATVSQEKARNSNRLDGKISFKVFNNITSDKMEWEYLGEFEEKTKKTEEAKTYIINELQNMTGATFKDLEEKSEAGNSNLRLALKELVKEKKIDSSQKGRAKFYFLTKS